MKNIQEGTRVRVNLSYTNIEGQSGVVTSQNSDDPHRPHTVLLDRGDTVYLYEGEMDVVPDKDREAVADRLHAKLCHWNHTDQCAYYYGPAQRRSALESYLPKADALLSKFPAETVIAVLDVLNDKG